MRLSASIASGVCSSHSARLGESRILRFEFIDAKLLYLAETKLGDDLQTICHIPYRLEQLSHLHFRGSFCFPVLACLRTMSPDGISKPSNLP
jgi:hypothetical protein